ncbi:tetratricopeptide repeat protein [Micromonospora sp. WMMD1128]|uniref:helix-turn-helix domain-containing protein n=1 Tax=Micromonospora sp. WMMD1128 TaxID=3015150 RepID=UPI00248B1E90|nr:helix-turn-helix domain-containing protein [Micromonospora sp. WMMD1128]WBB71919.1 tetratricopeptide repeat protein [Micromonospora sp. WMMD1128]
MTATDRSASPLIHAADAARTVPELAGLLRELRRREARQQGETQLTYRQLAAKTGWSRGVIGEYFAGNILPPTERFDILIRLLGATAAEQGALATARDRVEEARRQPDREETPAVRAGGGRARSRPARLPVPRQLPPALPGFVGRAAQLARLDAGDGRDGPAAGGPASTIVVLSGTAGVGKTTLAVHWAHRAAERFPDGQLYVDLRGFDATGAVVTPAEAVHGFLEALGVPPERMPVHLSAQVGLYRSLLADRRILVLLDNARDVEQVRPLLPGSPGCLVLVTSRNRLAGLIAAEGARSVPVGLLSAAESWQLLARRLGADRLTVEPQVVDEMVERCARLPLALAVLAARGAAHPAFPLATLAAELREAARLSDAFDTGDAGTDVQAVFSWSYRSLTPPAARLFRLIGCHPGPEIGIPAAASLAGLPRARMPRLLAELAHAHLLTEHAPGRFGAHDLLRAYAAELTERLDPDDERQAAIRRGLDHYLHSAHAAAVLLQPGWDPAPLDDAPPGVVPEEITDPAHALAWFHAEYRVLLAAVVYAERTRCDGHAWRLARTLVDFLQRQGRWSDLADAQRTALTAARRAGERAGQANAHRDLARALVRLGREEEAAGHYRNALAIFADLADDSGQARTHRAFGAMLDTLGRYEESLHHAARALALYQRTGHRAGQASARNAMGWAHARLGRYGAAREHCERALALLRRTDDRHGEANTWDSLGLIHDRLGHHRRAIRCFGRALTLYQRIGDRYDEADTLTRLGDCRHSSGDRAGALRTWRRALIILDGLGHPDVEGVRERMARASGASPDARATTHVPDASS